MDQGPNCNRRDTDDNSLGENKRVCCHPHCLSPPCLRCCGADAAWLLPLLLPRPLRPLPFLLLPSPLSPMLPLLLLVLLLHLALVLHSLLLRTATVLCCTPP